jgi:hypothetical protein
VTCFLWDLEVLNLENRLPRCRSNTLPNAFADFGSEKIGKKNNFPLDSPDFRHSGG